MRPATRVKKNPVPKIKGIKIRGADGSTYVLSMIDIAMHKAKAVAGLLKNPRQLMASKILPEFQKNPEKAREWAKKMKPEEMRFIKVKQADTPPNEDLAKGIETGDLE